MVRGSNPRQHSNAVPASKRGTDIDELAENVVSVFAASEGTSEALPSGVWATIVTGRVFTKIGGLGWRSVVLNDIWSCAPLAPLAQWNERLSYKQRVGGSTPSRCTKVGSSMVEPQALRQRVSSGFESRPVFKSGSSLEGPLSFVLWWESPKMKDE